MLCLKKKNIYHQTTTIPEIYLRAFSLTPYTHKHHHHHHHHCYYGKVNALPATSITHEPGNSRNPQVSCFKNRKMRQPTRENFSPHPTTTIVLLPSPFYNDIIKKMSAIPNPPNEAYTSWVFFYVGDDLSDVVWD